MASTMLRESPPASPNQPQIPLNSRFPRRVDALFWPLKVASRHEHYTDKEKTTRQMHAFPTVCSGGAGDASDVTGGLTVD
jgi:hypothetical protein